MGMVMSECIQPGPLVAKLSFLVSILLGLFMVWLIVIGIVKGIKIYWVNYFFIAVSFFSFHLLFGYSADHIPVEWAFAVSAAVSMALVASYLRLVVGPRFALMEAGVAQFVYLVVFALAHFLDGYTGLSLTVLGIGTLAAVMQLTAKVNWDSDSTESSVEEASPGGNQAE
jgi:inner membrane protein involved in colicin E2 resistance